MSGKMRMGMGAPGLQGLLKEGYKHLQGLEEAILRNVEACKMLSTMTRTSLGPNGMNKLVINHLEKTFVTSDTATMVSELEVEHPAAKMVVMAAKRQESEVGDGTNLVVTLAGELLSQCEGLLRMGVHPSEIVSGYKKATQKCLELLEGMANQSVSDVRSEEELAKALRPVLGAKQSGLEDILAGLVAKACVNVMPLPPKKPSINVDNVRVAKIIGGSIADSQVVKGLVVQRDAVGSVKSVSNAKIAVFGCPVEASSTETKGTVVIKNAEELKTYNKGEEQMIEEAIKGVADAGCNVIVSGGSISEMAMHFIEKYNLLALKIISKFELRRLCRAIGATACARLGPPMPEEIGQAASVSVQEIAGTRVTVFQQVESEDTGLSTIVLRGSTMSILDDLERAVDDGVNVAKALCKDTRLVPGAGATEIALSLALQKFGDATPGLEQYAINKFAQALEVVPRTLSENSGQNATDTLSALYSAHSSGKSAVGVCMEEGTATIDAAEAGIYDSFRVKDSAFRLATDAAITVMRVDQIIMAKQAGGPKPRQPGAPDL